MVEKVEEVDSTPHARVHEEVNEKRSRQRCVILPDSRFKVYWDGWISLLILASSVYTPLRVAFMEEVGSAQVAMELLVDAFFVGDIVLTFFSAYYDAQEQLVTQRGRIVRKYMCFWMWMDVLSVIPVSLIINSAGAFEVKNVARSLRLTRLPKMLKMARLLRVMRLAKQRSKLKEQLHRIGVNTSGSTERLLLFLLMFFVLCHFASCLWFLIAKLSDFGERTWVARTDIDPTDSFEAYSLSFYFIITSITTVGYGDISANTIA